MTREERARLRAEINAQDIRQLYQFDRSKSGLFCCPVCGSGTGDHKTGALKISDTGQRVTCFAHGCFSAQGQDVLGALQILWGTDEMGVFHELGYTDTEGRQTEKRPAPVRPVQDQTSPREAPPTDYVAYFREAQKRIGETDYPQRRGLSETTIKRFMLGYDPEWVHPSGKGTWKTPRLIIPISKGSYLARYIGDERNNAPKMKVGKADIFNGKALLSRGDKHQPLKVVYVVEGEIDAMSIIEAGGEAVALGSLHYAGRLVAYMGAHRAELYPRLHFIIALDNEAEPEKAESVARIAQELTVSLDGFGISHSLGNPHEGRKDPNQALCEDRGGFVAKVQAEMTAAVKEFSFTGCDRARRYRAMYAAAAALHERHNPVECSCVDWDAISADMTVTAAAFNDDPFIVDLLVAVQQELERESAAAGRVSPAE